MIPSHGKVSECDRGLVGGEAEVLCAHSHCQSVELGQVQHGDAVTEVLLDAVELVQLHDVDLSVFRGRDKTAVVVDEEEASDVAFVTASTSYAAPDFTASCSSP